MSAPRVFCFGELLWDCLPAGLFLGGAPMNVAAHLTRLGVPAGLISAVGDDFLGREAVERVQGFGVDTRFVVTEPGAPTGTVKATIGTDGSASYVIHENVAWDYIPLQQELEETVATAAALVFGSLALRTRFNRGTLDKLLAVDGPLKVFDVNLRPPHYDLQAVLRLARRSDVLKCNEDEARELTGERNGGPEALIEALAEKTGVARICITRGPEGAIYRGASGTVQAEAPQVTVVDTVGAGDAFLAALLKGIIDNAEADPDFLPACCRRGAFVASRPGAVPEEPRQ